MLFRRAILIALYKLSDIVILLCSLVLAVGFSGNGVNPLTLSHVLSVQITVRNLAGIIILVGIWHLIFQFFDLYGTRRFGSRLQECLDVVKAVSLGACVLTGLMSVFNVHISSGLFVFPFWVSNTVLTIAARMTMRFTLILTRNRGRNLRHMVVIGTNQRVKDFATKIRERKDLGYNLLGFVDNENIENSSGIELLADLNHFPDVLKRYVVDEVVIGLPIRSFYKEIKEILNTCEEQGIVVRFIADTFFDSKLAKSRMDYLEESPILTIYTGPLDSWSLRIKRTEDFVFSVIALLFLLPLFIIAGLLIKLDSPGPIFFHQNRVGYNKRLFRMYKLRTMIQDAESKQSELEHLNEMCGPVFKIKDDPRVTRIGRILRKTSIES